MTATRILHVIMLVLFIMLVATFIDLAYADERARPPAVLLVHPPAAAYPVEKSKPESIPYGKKKLDFSVHLICAMRCMASEKVGDND